MAAPATKKHEAIVIFELKNPEEMFKNFSGREYLEDTEDWYESVKFFRSGGNVGGKPMEKKLRKLDFIFGPIADGGVSRTTTRNPDPKPMKDGSYQLCIKSADMADDFYNYGENIHKTIFFRDMKQ